MLRTVAKSPFGFEFMLVMPNNDDQSNPTPARVVGGVGPFNFSGAVAPAAVTLKWKIDGAAEQTDTVDLSSVGNINAVTVDELVAAVTATTPSGLTASKETGTGRFKIVMTTPGTTKFFQVYGEVAKYSRIGQGFTTKIVKSNTIKSFQVTPTQKAAESFTTMDANGGETEVKTPPKVKGFTAAAVDTARDPELRSIIEGGSYDPTTKKYEIPGPDAEGPTFCIWGYTRLYAQTSSKEPDVIGYVEKFYRTCMGSVGQDQMQRAFTDGNYSIEGTAYVDESVNKFGPGTETELTKAQYAALNLLNV